jgi:hypothetical protein
MTAEKWPWAVALGLLAATASVSPADAGEPRPTVLFVGGVHAGYAAKPLHAMGIELDTCKRGQLAERLAALEAQAIAELEQALAAMTKS